MRSAKKRRATPAGKFNALFRRGTSKTGSAPEGAAPRRSYHSRTLTAENALASSRGELCSATIQSISQQPSRYSMLHDKSMLTYGM